MRNLPSHWPSDIGTRRVIIAIDYDGTIVTQDLPYNDVTTAPTFMPGAVEGLKALKRAGHKLLLYSARANLALRENPYLNPLITEFDEKAFEQEKTLQVARYWAMVQFVRATLPGIFDAIDNGHQGKPTADLFIDDKNAFAVIDWSLIAAVYGDPESDIEVP